MKDLLQVPLRALVVAILLAAGLPACKTDGEAVCDSKCDCQRCGDLALDECYAESDNKAREASVIGCVDQYDALMACEYDTGFCKSNFEWETSCKIEKERYDACRK